MVSYSFFADSGVDSTETVVMKCSSCGFQRSTARNVNRSANKGVRNRFLAGPDGSKILPNQFITSSHRARAARKRVLAPVFGGYFSGMTGSSK